MQELEIHGLRIRTFCHNTEEIGKVREALEFLAPKTVFSEKNTTGGYGDQIVVLEAELKQKNAQKVLEKLKKIPKTRLLSEVEERVDEDACFYLRLDKQKLYQGETRLYSREGGVVWLKIKTAVYPKKKQTAVEKIREFFSQ